MKYECNRKHKEPFQPGRKGSLCPSTLTEEKAQELLYDSEGDDRHRYATFEGRAYKALQHREDVFHGFPIGFQEVPEKIRILWLKRDLVTLKQIRDGW